MMRYTSGDFREIPMTVKTYDNIITSNSTEFPTRRRKNNNNNGYCVKNVFGSYDYNTKYYDHRATAVTSVHWWYGDLDMNIIRV